MDPQDAPRRPHGWKFWVLFASICSCTFLTGLDVVSISLLFQFLRPFPFSTSQSFPQRLQLAPLFLPLPMTSTGDRPRLHGSRRPTRSLPLLFSLWSVALPIHLVVAQYVLSPRDRPLLTLSSDSCRVPRILHGRICHMWDGVVHGNAHRRTGYAPYLIGCNQPTNPLPAIQGAGAGGIQASSLIVVADLTSLSDRGLFTGINNL